MTEQITDPFKTPDETNYLAELVGEGKKFATVDDLAKGKWHSDALIEVMKGEIASLKETTANGANVQTLLEEIKKLKGNTEGIEGQPQDQSQGNPPAQNIEELVLNTLEKTRREETVKKNREEVIDKLSNVWGADAAKELKKTADALGVSVDYLNGVAQQSPNAFYRLTGLDVNRAPTSGTTVPQGTVRLGGPNSQVRDAKFYRELKQSNPKLYNDPKTRIQQHKDAMELGEAYFN